MRTTPHEWGGISRKISDRFPADLPRVGMGNDLLNWGDSSPRGRGKRSLAGDLDERVRLIPARAGKTA